MKNHALAISAALLAVLLALYSAPAAEAARAGFVLWREFVMPALLPFFVCSSLLARSSLSGSSAALFILSFISGAPSGARLAAAFCGDEKACSLRAAALNTVSPMYVFAAFSTGMLGVPRLALPIIAGQLIASAALFIPLSRRYPVCAAAPTPGATSAARLAAEAIGEAVAGVIRIGGAIVVFSVLGALLEATGALDILSLPFVPVLRLLKCEAGVAKAFFCGLLEMASGGARLALSSIPLRPLGALSAFIFTFGGACIGVQSALFMPIRFGRYFAAKAAAGAVAALAAYLLFPLFFLGSSAASALIEASLVAENALSAAAIFASSLLSMGTVLLFCAAVRKKPTQRGRR